MDDVEIIQNCLAGRAEAYESLYASHSRRVRAYFGRCGFSAADADDLTQEAFIRAFGSLRTFDATRGSFGGWLTAIVRNVARRHFNRRADARDFDPELAERTLADHSNPGHSAERQEEIDALEDCIALLPKELGTVIRLRYVEARTTRGIAVATGMPESTVRLRLSEAKAALASCLRTKGITSWNP